LCSRPTFLSFVREHFPALEADYVERFAGRDFVAPDYKRKMVAIVGEVCRKYGLGGRSREALPEDPEATKKSVATVPVGVQQRLFG
jgi:hypothetical protein